MYSCSPTTTLPQYLQYTTPESMDLLPHTVRLHGRYVGRTSATLPLGRRGVHHTAVVIVTQLLLHSVEIHLRLTVFTIVALLLVV